MRTQSIYFVTILLVLTPMASAQWVRMPQSPAGECLAVSGPNLLVARHGRYTSPAALYTSTDNGTTWDTTKYFTAYAFVVSGTKVYAGGDVLRCSTDNGLSWVGAGSTGHPITAVVVAGATIFAGTTGGGVFLSTDNGQNWNALSPGWTSTTVRAFALAGTDLFAGTTGGVVLSTDNGTRWSAVNSGLPTLDVRALLVHQGHIYAGLYEEGVCVSVNNSATWNKASIGSTNHCTVTAFAFNGAYLFAGTDEGVFLTSNGGTRWSAANSGLTDTIVYALAVSCNDLLALTSGGVWRRPLREMITSVDTAVSALPDAFRLQQNYPNPFNPSTSITFTLARASVMRLSVFDVLGREVSVLVNERRDAGVHEVKFDGATLASGVYVCRMQTGSFVASRKMMLAK